jgi:hypothetical protein
MLETSYEDLGLIGNPFESIIADERSASRYGLYGREDQIKRLEEFVRSAARANFQKRILVMGEYGTGKTHHLINLREEIINGKYGSDITAIYLGNLSISFRKFYENIIEALKQNIPALRETLERLPDVEPSQSVESTYAPEKLRENIITNLNRIMADAKINNIRGIFLLVDEAEDIVQWDDNDKVQYFIQSLLHLINKLQGTPLHIIMGFSREAVGKISTVDSSKSSDRRLGDAFWQRFFAEDPIRLGNLREKDATLMILDRLNSARVVPSDSLYPIKQEVISVVTRYVGGNPREILTIFSRALHETQRSGKKEVNGSRIIQILAKHESFFNKTIVLDWNRLESIRQNIAAENEALEADFTTLMGVLIGEGKSVTEDDFTNPAFAEELTKPIHGIRILERKTNRDGETFYTISPEVISDIFRGKRYGSETEQDIEYEIIDLMTNPGRYQDQLAKGFWKVLQKEMNAEFKARHVYDDKLVISGKCRIGNSPIPYSLALTAFKGVEFPEALYKGLIDLIESKQATFGAVLYDSTRLEIDPVYQKFRRDLKEARKEIILESILTIESSKLPIPDDQLMGKIKLLGNPEVKNTDEIDTSDLLSSIGIVNEIEQLVFKKVIPFPGDPNVRRVIEKLAEDQTRSYSLTELKNECNAPYLDSETLNGLLKQRFVKKDGARWQIASLDLDPVWKLLYGFIYQEKGATLDEIKEFLECQYILQCSPGEELRLLNWYIELLIKLEMITGAKEGASVVYRLLDHSQKLDVLITQCEDVLSGLRSLLAEAAGLNIAISDYDRKVDTLKGRLDPLTVEPEPGSDHIIRAKNILDDIRNIENALSGEIKSTRKSYASTLSNCKEQIDLTKERICGAFEQGIITDSEHTDWQVHLDDLYAQASENLKDGNFSALTVYLSQLDNAIKTNTKEIRDRETSKEPCISYAKQVEELKDTIKNLLTDLEGLGYSNLKYLEDFAGLNGKQVREYVPLFNEGKYADALQVIESIHGELVRLQGSLATQKNNYQNYEQKIAAHRASVPKEPQGLLYLDEAEEALRQWDFATTEVKLSQYLDALKKREEPVKTPEEEFIEKFSAKNTVTLDTILESYTVDRAFKLLQNLYIRGDIEVIEIRIKKNH